MQDSLAKLIALVESEFGQPSPHSIGPRSSRRCAVWIGMAPSTLRNAVDVIADAFSVSRATLHNYLRSNREHA